MKPKSEATIAVINAVQKGKSIDQIAKETGLSKNRIYNIKWKMKQSSKEKVRKYVRKTPHHPKKLQEVGPYVRGAKKAVKFQPPRSLEIADVLTRNQDLYNEIKDQQAIIRYLEGLVMRLTKSN